MDRADFRLRALLLQIEQDLTVEERRNLCFIIGCEDVPRRHLDAISKDPSAPMNEIWESLFDRRKITTGNVNYLIERLERLQRADLVERLKSYCPLPFSLSAAPLASATEQTWHRSADTDLFTRIDP